MNVTDSQLLRRVNGGTSTRLYSSRGVCPLFWHGDDFCRLYLIIEYGPILMMYHFKYPLDANAIAVPQFWVAPYEDVNSAAAARVLQLEEGVVVALARGGFLHGRCHTLQLDDLPIKVRRFDNK